MANQLSESQSSDDLKRFNESQLFKLEPLFDFTTRKCTFCENGQKKVFAAVSDNSFHIVLMKGDGNRSSKEIPWDTKKNSIVDLCFDPSATWLLVLSPATLHVVPVFPLLEPGSEHDLKWPTNKITRITLNPDHAKKTTAIVWWQTRESQHIAIIGDENGDLIFFSLENLEIIGKSYIVGGVSKLRIYVDASLDQITLLITGNKNRQWKLTLEDWECQYNWLSGRKLEGKSRDAKKRQGHTSRSKESGHFDFLDTCVDLLNDMFSNVQEEKATCEGGYFPSKARPVLVSFEFVQKASVKDDSKTTPAGEDQSQEPPQWVVTPQTADGRHFISFFNAAHGTFILQLRIGDHTPSSVFKLGDIPPDIHTILWRDSIIYTFGKTSMKIHSSYLASQQDTSLYTTLWEDELGDDEEIVAAFGVGELSNFPQCEGKWINTTDVSKLDLPRFNLDSCMVVSDKRTYLLTTRCDPCEWMVRRLVVGNAGVERTAAALRVGLQPLLVGAADLLLANDCFSQALPLYKLAKMGSDEPLKRCAAMGLYREMLTCGFNPQSASTANICFIGHALQILDDPLNQVHLLKFIEGNSYFSVPECLTLCADLGLWKAIQCMCFSRGMLWQSFQCLLLRFKSPCRGLWDVLLTEHYSPFIVTDCALPLLKYIEQYSESFDTILLQKLCVWMCPLQDCFQNIYRALSTSQPNIHLSGMRRLIRTFFGVLSTLHSRIGSSLSMDLSSVKMTAPKDLNDLNNADNLKKAPIVLSPQPMVSCGQSNWAITSHGKVCVSHADGSPGLMSVDVELIGQALSVACGRHHTLFLTENGVYSLGNNRYGQLGAGSDIGCSLDTPLLVGTMGRTDDVSNKREFCWAKEIVISIEAGQYHSACVTDKGSLFTWGWGVHGQLGHGDVFDQFTPKKVATLGPERVRSVSCGACHTSILTHSGRVYVCGSGAFGQIGHSDRTKSNIPHRVALGPSPVIQIASGNFHTLARTESGELWMWGSSPQSLRVGARGARRRGKGEEVVALTEQGGEENPHLYPTRVNTVNVQGRIIQMAAGWHHSCLIDDMGGLYVWGLNLDGQLGTGDQKEVLIPSLVETLVENYDKSKSPPKEISISVPTSQALSKLASLKNLEKKKVIREEVQPTISGPEFGFARAAACGGDFTVFLNTEGKFFITGNSYSQFQDTANKGGLRVVKLKNTQRIIRLPQSRPIAQRKFRHLPIPIKHGEPAPVIVQNTFDRLPNPISSLEDFKQSFWAVDILKCLYQFVDDDTPLVDIHFRAQLAYLRNDYAEALNLRLNALLLENQPYNVPVYLKHSPALDDKPQKVSVLHEILLKNLKILGRNLLKNCNSASGDGDSLYCQCDESSYLVDINNNQPISAKRADITTDAVSVTKSILKILPKGSASWGDCVNQATLFWMDNELNMSKLEEAFSDIVADGCEMDMASAVFCSKDSVDYQKHLSSDFNLELCDKIVQSW